MALETTLEAPAPVRRIAMLLDEYVNRLGVIWVEGQIAQINRRPGMQTVFMTLRDTVADVSIPLTCPRVIVDSLNPPLVDGASVVVQAKTSYYANRGTLSLAVRDIRTVGLGDLLAQLERRRQLLAAEGLFARELKRPLPFLPTAVGLVTAPNSAAERDVLENARRRWPQVRFEVAYAAMQGQRSAADVIEAVQRLDRNPDVDVIVIARGGGSVEDLLPFSDEALIRTVAAARTPVVSAIGHEPDSPILDLVADVRASTPTDAGKLVVPDVGEELQRIAQARLRLTHGVQSLIEREQLRLDTLRSRPVLADPTSLIAGQSVEITSLRDRARRRLEHGLDHAGDDIHHSRARVRALSPLETLRRGYAVVQDEAGHVVASVDNIAAGARFAIRVTDGYIASTADAVQKIEEVTHGEE